MQDFDVLLKPVIRLRVPSGAIRYLLRVWDEECGHCPTGTRTVSVWVSMRGDGEAVAWCSHCFNATCESVEMEEDYVWRYERVLAAIARGEVSLPWRGARLALEDLSRRMPETTRY